MTYIPSKRLALELAPLFLLILIPLSVHASFFVSFIGLMDEQKAEASVHTSSDALNVQSMPLLKAANHPDPNPAKGGGDVIVEEGALVPFGDFEGGEDNVNSRTANGEISVYVVREGDTLSQIAEMFDVSANTILWANDIARASLIQPGSTLVILPVTGVRHVVKKGDTIASIAKKYDGDVDEILSYNQLASASDITIGDTVVVPSGVLAAPASSSASPSRASGGAAVATGNGSSGFSHPLPGGMRTQGIHGYNGVDLAASVGTPVISAAAGEVIVAKGSGWNGGYGNYVVIKHPNGTQTLYAHLASVSVTVGMQVGVGRQVGIIGNTGRSTGVHLHFEVRGARNPF